MNSTKLSTDASACAIDCRSYVENSKVSESLLLMKFYSLSTGAVNHLLSDLEGREVDLPFEVTDEEREIIKFPRSSFILGRSGTGKTTILTMKLYRMLQQYYVASQDCVVADNSVHISSQVGVGQYLGESRGTILRQLFVTVSPKLCYAVKKHILQLKGFASGNLFGNKKLTDIDDIDEMAEFKDIPDTFIGIQPEKYPLMITFHKFLMMVDGTLGNSFFQRFRDVRDSSRHEGRRSVALQTFIRKNEVTYDRFLSLYWPHISEKLKKNLDPSRVFIEIMSHIKGGLQEGEACDSKRSRQHYISLSDSRISTLSAEKREAIYNIFEAYEKMKMALGEFDLADFVIDIHIRVNNGNLPGDKMDFVYIDEVQDLTMRQISLFRYICKNVDEGFVFSGDTAQTIARGIDFRFEDIRSLFYNEFFMKSRNCEFSGRREKGHISDVFSLSQNFRTHTGVLRLAQSVIDLICHFFPQSIDVLAPETSLIYGESPVVFEPGNDENSIVTIFGHSGNAGGKWVGFGADQVILVRDDSARKEISNYIGDQALVLTIVECKGLEFQDVLLYNFFGSSPMSSQWRVVYEFLNEKDLLDANSPKSFPSFSQSRHNILCSELKQLYVAITRTRQRLWICENNEELSKPMFDYWKRLCLVQVRKIDDSLAEAMQRASSPEEWKLQGIKLFWEKNYEMAIMCFEKAGEERWERRAKACGLRAAADRLCVSNPEEGRVMLREAAEMFDSIGRADSAAECFCDLGDFERAGKIYSAMSELRKAGECFSLAGSYEIAANVYAQGFFFEDCLSACTKGNLFDLALHNIEYWKQQASGSSGTVTGFGNIDKIAQEFLEKCALGCYSKSDNASLMKFVRAFPTMESKRNFLKSLDCLEELLILEEELLNFNEAADIAKCLGDILREVDLLEKAEEFASASLLILSHVLSSSLWASGSQGWPLKSFPGKQELLTKAMSLAQRVSGTFHASLCAEAKILSNEHKSLSELMQCHISSKQYESHVGEVLSIRKLLDAHFRKKTAKYELEPELHIDPTLCIDRISKNQVSGGTLVYVWYLWKLHSLEIFECLDTLERLDFIRCEGTVKLCFSYFGVRLRHDLSVTCLLLNPDAAWVRNVDKRFMLRHRNVVTLDARHFASAARKYWHQELLPVGLRVLEALHALYKCSLVNPLSKYYQSVYLTCIFDITKFFESNSLDIKKDDTRKLENFLQLSTKYFEIVFPFDPRLSLSEDIISLRESEPSKNLLEEIISRNLGTRNELTYGQIGRVVMIMLGSGKPKPELYEKITKRIGKESSWKSFFDKLGGIMESDSSTESELGSSVEALSHEFYKALEETYNANWRAKDYISPQCFFYLVERLLILMPHSQDFFFTTKSSFVEYLLSLQSDANPSAGLVTEKRYHPRNIVSFVYTIVRECVYNRQITAEWIKTSYINCTYYFPVLLLRLFVILSLLCLNSEVPFNVLFELLCVPAIRSQLPREFCQAFLRRKNDLSLAAVVEAFKVIGDPLVIVSTTDNGLEFACPDAVFLDLRAFSCRTDIMKTLFPRSSNASYSQLASAEGNVTESSSVEFPPVVMDQGKSTYMESSILISKTDSNLSSEKGKCNVLINWGLIRELFDAIDRNHENLKSFFLRKKVEVEEHINFLTVEMVRLTEQRSNSGEDKTILCEATSIINELNRLSSLLVTSEFDDKALSEIGELLNSLEARRPQLDTLLIPSPTQNDPNGCLVSGTMDENTISHSNDSTEVREREDVNVAVNNPKNQASESRQGKGKSKKKNKKSNKGRGGRGK
ncbi:UNVERIFIED_CONTAM: TPR and ankyrin repeat-containing protein 1 [Sesamum calycinum]|uniref:TPR and ankyrin repeat-containing protein 1 n=1 Tax=Sesamum calycinum TaxID=2727403 RepID=A0AAW2RCU8_9LAMI